MIVFDHVTKKYGETAAIDEVSVQINPGEFVLVLGPSGAGKTTLGKLLINQTKMTSGEIQVGEFKLSEIKKKELPVLRRQVAVIFQDYQLLPDRTAAENVALALEITNKSETEIKEAIPELLKRVGLEDKADLFPNQLSGGESQRVVIARALATDPVVIFADEPTGNLDVQNALKVVELLEKINAQGTTVIMATHDESLIKRDKKRIIRLEHGKVKEETKA